MKHILFFIFIATAKLLWGQAGDNASISSELIIHLEEKVDIGGWLRAKKATFSQSINLKHIKKLGIRHNIHHLSFDETGIDLDDFMSTIRSQKEVLTAQYNYRVAFRNTPNDTLSPQQWDMDIINAHQAWEVTTGGTTPSGTKIVVANMESGIEINHRDLYDNLWHNPAEILGDSIDNDNNGYIDDDIGWDYYTDSPKIVPGIHGTSTTGIIGAKGNNTTGVTGVNWDVDLMLFTFSGLISDLIQSYEYVIDQRMRFNESQGNEGAFVVVVNASFGDDRTCCKQQPTWASMFELMGEVGILTSSGTANQPFNVDNSCDFPASCTSEYLVISCNTDSDDNLSQTSAYGAVSVDFGAPGDQSFTTKVNNTYGAFNGNSAATPHVTGAIALLYSAPFAAIEQMAISQPSETALMIRDFIISNVTPVAALQKRTVTGGRLDLGKSMEKFVENFSNFLGDLTISHLFPNPANEGININFLTPVNGDYFAEIYNTIGQLVARQKVFVGETGIRSFYIPTHQLPQGFYVLSFGKGEKQVARKFIIAR